MRRNIRLAIVAAGPALAHGVDVGATQQDDFLSTRRRFGITNSVLASKKPCLCSDGTENGEIGRLVRPAARLKGRER